MSKPVQALLLIRRLNTQHKKLVMRMLNWNNPVGFVLSTIVYSLALLLGIPVNLLIHANIHTAHSNLTHKGPENKGKKNIQRMAALWAATPCTLKSQRRMTKHV